MFTAPLAPTQRIYLDPRWRDHPDIGALVNIPMAYRLVGCLDLAALDAAFRWVVARHDSLRTSFIVDDTNSSIQIIAREVDAGISIHSAEADVEVPQVVARALWSRIELTEAPLVRMSVIVMGERDHVLVIAAHHAVFDGESVKLLLADLSEGYNAILAGQHAENVQSDSQFAEFARRSVKTHETDQARWHRELAEVQLVRGEHHASHRYHPIELALRLNAAGSKLASACGRYRATPLMLLCAAYARAHALVDATPDAVILVPISARRKVAALARTIGCCAGPGILHVRRAQGETVDASISDVRAAIAKLLLNTPLPVWYFVSEYGMVPSLSLESEDVCLPSFQGISAEIFPRSAPVRMFDFGPRGQVGPTLVATARRDRDGFACSVEYNSCVVSQKDIEALAEHWARQWQEIASSR